MSGVTSSGERRKAPLLVNLVKSRHFKNKSEQKHMREDSDMLKGFDTCEDLIH